MGEQGVREVVAYALSLSGRKVNADLAEAGQARFGVCAGCHGANGKGNQALGAPNLTDTTWLYGGTQKKVLETVLYGRQNYMPSFAKTLGPERVHLMAAYVYSLSNK
jgi:cytochrome c oxidase cbb3-type subunit 3